MASAKRSELGGKVEALAADLDEKGVLGLLEHSDFARTIQDLVKLNDDEHLTTVLNALGTAAEDTICADESELATLVVLAQLMRDVDSLDSDSNADNALKDLQAKLQLAFISALGVYALPGSQEGKDLMTAGGGLAINVYDKVQNNRLLALAVEKALLQLLSRKKQIVVFLREREYLMAVLRQSIEELKDYLPTGAELQENGEDEDEDEDEDEFEGEEDEEDDEDDA